MNMSIIYQKSGEPVKGFADADWANDKLDRKSYSGYVFFLAGSAFSWTSAKQSVVAMSSTEAEYVALSTAAREAVYLQGLLQEIGYSN
ncbi:secreted RxLR effector protein 161-like [Drosophila miranda]|uniref:secreted RxLR effector protein 161-like n=1 Tax=Drosophila miranda TaxID=7229 RepID=UPI00143F43AA|nr:secreted RxLR effector protein 161-like [Drosophila miranda]